MQGIYRLLKATLLGGLLVLVPLLVFGALVAWVVEIALKVIGPMLEWLPDRSVSGVSLTVAIGVLGVLALCFVAGLFAQTALIRFLSERAERIALSVPGYALMKSVGVNFVGIEGKHAAKTVLVRLEASWQLGFLMDTFADGRHVVFLPGVPRALVGTLHVFAADRVAVLKMSIPTALDTLGRLGVGFGETWSKEPAATLKVDHDRSSATSA